MASPGELLHFAAGVADMTTSAEYTPMEPDDATHPLDGLIKRARAMLGYPADFRPEGLDEDEGEDDCHERRDALADQGRSRGERPLLGCPWDGPGRLDDRRQILGLHGVQNHDRGDAPKGHLG